MIKKVGGILIDKKVEKHFEVRTREFCRKCHLETKIRLSLKFD
jgi:hypothetical protein